MGTEAEPFESSASGRIRAMSRPFPAVPNRSSCADPHIRHHERPLKSIPAGCG